MASDRFGAVEASICEYFLWSRHHPAATVYEAWTRPLLRTFMLNASNLVPPLGIAWSVTCWGPLILFGDAVFRSAAPESSAD